MNDLKEKAAKAALQFIDDHMIVGVGTGSTVNFFIQQLEAVKHRIDACVASSKATEQLLRKVGIEVIDLNVAIEVAVYVDGADEVTKNGCMIKGGGGALTREKILANAAHQFVCIVDESKLVSHLGAFPLAIEVIPMARSLVARRIVQLGGDPVYREGLITDNGNIILDVYNLDLTNPSKVEDSLKLLPGVVENGVFAHRCADKIIVAREEEIQIF